MFYLNVYNYGYGALLSGLWIFSLLLYIYCKTKTQHNIYNNPRPYIHYEITTEK